MSIRFDRFPGGRTKALTLSFDDGREYDRRFVKKLNEYGLKGTFHLNDGFFGRESYIEASEVAELYAGHEVSAHTVRHPFLEQSPTEQIVREIKENREALEKLAGYPVRGMSYPFGTYNDRVISLLPALGIEYARTVASHGTYQIPNDFLRWHPTCHHKQMVEHAEQFLRHDPRHSRMALLYVWGHSYEFENDDNWDLIDRFGEIIAGREEIWVATNAEIVAYMDALKRLRFSANCEYVQNPSALAVWLSANGEVVEVPAGQLVRLQ